MKPSFHTFDMIDISNNIAEMVKRSGKVGGVASDRRFEKLDRTEKKKSIKKAKEVVRLRVKNQANESVTTDDLQKCLPVCSQPVPCECATGCSPWKRVSIPHLTSEHHLGAQRRDGIGKPTLRTTIPTHVGKKIYR